MIASGSIEGSEKSRSLVATNFTQSVDPASGTRSTFIPAFANHPNLVAMAKGDAAELIVLAQKPTRMVFRSPCAKTGAPSASQAHEAQTASKLSPLIGNRPPLPLILFLLELRRIPKQHAPFNGGDRAV